MQGPALLAVLSAGLLAGAPAATGTTGSGPLRIAFVSNRSSTNTDLYVMNVDGSNQQRVTTTPAFSEQASSWSPDGLRIAFQTRQESNVDRGDAIAVMGKAGGIKLITTGFTPGRNYQDDLEPEWSPDGTRIAFARSTGNGYRIFTIRPNGTGLAAVTAGGFDRAPTWSPDGTRIAFVRSGKLLIVNADGSGQAQVPVAGYLSSPKWSPNGAMFAFTRANAKTGATDIFAAPVAGGAAHQLTKTPALSERFPSWSPDGTRIAFQLRAYGGDIYVMNANGAAVTRLTTSPKSDALPTFTR